MSTVTVAELEQAYQRYKQAPKGQRLQPWHNYFRLVAHYCKGKCHSLERRQRLRCFKACMRVLLHEGPSGIKDVDKAIQEAISGSK